jgi:xanthine dehydrogenase YagS FAD-binding subunit
MRQFTHLDVTSVSQASANAGSGTMFIAGGTDLLGTLKDEILPMYPSRIINLKTIGSLDYIKEENGQLKIGPLVTLDRIANDDTIKGSYTCLSEAAVRTSAPTQRKMGTIGGNICQMHRCWYFRTPDNRFHCLRKGGDYCPASIGEGRNHSIFGSDQGCIAASSHDTAPALMALNATIVTNKGSYAADGFFAVNGVRSTVLAEDEIVTEIQIPGNIQKSVFVKFAERKAIDFPIVNCAAAQTADGLRIACGGVYPIPLRMLDAEAAVASGISESSAQAAGNAAVANASPLAKSAYKVEIARTLVKRALLALAK